MSRHETFIPTDDAPLDEGPRLHIHADLDWYMGVVDVGQRFSMSYVRFCTSGSRNHRLALAVALLDAVAREDEARVRSLATTLSHPW